MSDLTACTLTLTVHTTYRMRFTFEHVDLSEPTEDGLCNDYVQLFNGAATSRLLLSAPICGSRPPQGVFTSNTSVVSLVFASTSQLRQRHRPVEDPAAGSSGFRIKYERISLAELEQLQLERAETASSDVEASEALTSSASPRSMLCILLLCVFIIVFCNA